MEFLTDSQKETLSIKRMIFHIVGTGEEPVLLSEIKPIQHIDFFLSRVKSALRGNRFSFKANSPVEKALRSVSTAGDNFVEKSKELAVDFDSRHSGITSPGAFFLFELDAGEDDKIFALIKYDNEDVVRYLLDNVGKCRVPDDQIAYRSYPLLAARELLQQFIREQVHGHQAA